MFRDCKKANHLSHLILSVASGTLCVISMIHWNTAEELDYCVLYGHVQDSYERVCWTERGNSEDRISNKKLSKERPIPLKLRISC
jgi:hypothetical protein